MGEKSCPKCKATVFHSSSGQVRCSRCGGSGKLNDKECRKCQGTGRQDCPRCHGSGVIRD